MTSLSPEVHSKKKKVVVTKGKECLETANHKRHERFADILIILGLKASEFNSKYSNQLFF